MEDFAFLWQRAYACVRVVLLGQSFKRIVSKIYIYCEEGSARKMHEKGLHFVRARVKSFKTKTGESANKVDSKIGWA